MVCGFGAKLYSVGEPYDLPEFSSVFQVEVLRILENCRCLEHNLSPKHNKGILTDSQAAIKTMLRTLGKPFLESLRKISSCMVGGLLSFVNATAG